MTGTVINPVLAGLALLAVVVGIVAPLGTLSIMFWHWHKELYPVRGWHKKRSNPDMSFPVVNTSK